MSYILDALRKADAQRERDPARGIHAQGMEPRAFAPEARRAPPAWAWVGLGIGAVVVAGAGWTFLDRSRTQKSTPDHVVVASVPASPSVAPALPGDLADSRAAQPLPPAPAATHFDAKTRSPGLGASHPGARVAEPPARNVRLAAASAATDLRVAQAQVPESAPGMPPPGISDRPVRGAPGGVQQAPAAQQGVQVPPGAVQQQGVAPPGMPPQVPAQQIPMQAPVQQAPVQQAAPMTGSVPPSAPPRPVSSATAASSTAPATGLPSDAPKLQINGGVFSHSPAQRMLIVNGQVYNEGSEIAPGVTLDAIQPRTAILRFHGQRYTVTY